MFIVEEFRKKQRKSHLNANLQYFMDSGCKTDNSHISKVKKDRDVKSVTALISRGVDPYFDCNTFY